MKFTTRFLLSFILIVASCGTLAPLPAYSQINLAPTFDKNGRGVLGGEVQFQLWSPADLGMNAATLPASNPTAESTLIKSIGVHNMTLTMNCTQATDVYMQVYLEDGLTTAGRYKLVTAMPAGVNQINVATELAPNSTAGTLATTVRFPQMFFTVSFTNTTATPGTCTARLYAGYN